MKQLDFENKHRAFWQLYSQLLKELENNNRSEFYHEHWPTFPQLYRKMCQHLSTAQSRQYSPRLTDSLHQLVLRGHRYLYRQKSYVLSELWTFIRQDFPVALRQKWRFWLVSSCFFYMPALFMAMACFLNNELLHSFLSFEQVKTYEFMFNPENSQLGRPEERQADSDFLMFGYYIFNNVGIDFKAYAGGLAFGLGSAFFMVLNGLIIGGVAGHLTGIGYSETFWSFVAGHSALELTGATIAGAAGFQLGYALINPKQYSRLLALKQAGRESFPLIAGAAFLTVIAAFVEGFWSATPSVPVEVKYGLGLLAWLALFFYLLMAGRRREVR